MDLPHCKAKWWPECSEALHERLSKYQVMLEEQKGATYRLTDELAAKEEQILRLKSALDLRKAGRQGDTACLCVPKP